MSESDAIADLALILEGDLQRIEMTQEQLAEQLNVTQQAISLWKARGYIPKRRIPEVLAVLGKGSELARAVEEERIPLSPVDAAFRKIDRDNVGSGTPQRRESDRLRTEHRSRMMRWVTAHDAALELVRNHVPDAATQEAIDVNGARRVYDYVSEHFVATLKRAPVLRRSYSDQPPLLDARPLSNDLLNLMLLSLQEGHRRACLLYLVCEDTRVMETEQVRRALNRLARDAEVLRVTLVVVSSADEAAKDLLRRESVFQDFNDDPISDSDALDELSAEYPDEPLF
jgi:transcriptional regulator with XRE-family HTH domain